MSDNPTGPRPDDRLPDDGGTDDGRPDERGGPGSYPPPGYPTAPPAYATTSTPFSIGDALGFAFRRYGANWRSWVLVALLLVAVELIWNLITGGAGDFHDVFGGSSGTASVHLGLGGALLKLVGLVLAYFVTAFLSKGGLLESGGRKPAVGEFFRVRNMGSVVLAAVFVGIGTAVGLVLCILPGLAVALFSAFTYFVALDRNLGASDSIRASWQLVSKDFGSVLGLMVLLLLLNIVGLAVCFVGLLVTIPVSYIAVGYAYRALSGAKAV